MKLAGKAAPETDDLDRVADAGFDHVELYLESHHLDSYERSVKVLEASPVDVVAVHTPHVPAAERDYIEKASFLAERFDALLVMHSRQLFINDAIELGNELAYGNIAYEHDPGFSRRAIENMILGRGEQLVLDAAHLYIASEQFEEDFEALLETATHLHLSDSTAISDGLPFGEGTMAIETMVEQVQTSGFDGYTVIEVMPKHQRSALERIEELTGGNDD